ncbi:MAG: hypothetical protein ACI83W_000686 [Marinoscillum sp.]
MQNRPQVYFHVGLGKVASTYLQKEVFPRLEGIQYIPTGRYRKSKEIITKSYSDKILVSREFDRQFEEELRWFAADYPNCKVIILLRRHDDWIASQYRRHVKNGFYHDFEAFLDMKEDKGFWQQKELHYMSKLKLIEELTHKPPLVLFYDELKENPEGFVKSMIDFMGVPPLENLSRRLVHKSFSDKQLKVLRSFCRKYVRRVPINHRNKWKHWLCYRPVWAAYHVILYTAAFLPESWITKEPLIENELLDVVRLAFNEDWAAVRQFS